MPASHPVLSACYASHVTAGCHLGVRLWEYAHNPHTFSAISRTAAWRSGTTWPRQSPAPAAAAGLAARGHVRRAPVPGVLAECVR